MKLMNVKKLIKLVFFIGGGEGEGGGAVFSGQSTLRTLDQQ